MAVTLMKKMIKSRVLRTLHSNKPFFDIWIGCVACFISLSVVPLAFIVISPKNNSNNNNNHLQLLPYESAIYIFVFLLFSIFSRALRCCYFRINAFTFTDGQNLDCLLEGIGIINRDYGGVDQWEDMEMVSLVSGHRMDHHHQNPSSLVHSEDLV